MFERRIVSSIYAIGLAGAVIAAAACGASASDPEADTARISSALDTTSCSPARAAPVVPPFQKALLDLIATGEGTYRRDANDGYDLRFSFETIPDCTTYVAKIICDGICSDAAGRYQFKASTWNGLGHAHFYPSDQDQAAMQLITGTHQVTVPINRAFTHDEFVNAMNALSGEWASLPNSPYGQPTLSMDQAWSIYSQYVSDAVAHGDIPVVGHFEDSPFDNLAVYRPSIGTFFIRAANGNLLSQVTFGNPGDLPAVGHYEDSPFDNLAVYRPSEGAFYIRAANGNLVTKVSYGNPGDKPAVGHFENSPFTNLAVYRPSEGAFYVRAANGNLLTSISYGNFGDLPLVGHFQDSPFDNLAVYRPSEGAFYIRAANGGLLANVPYGNPGDIPLAGHFQDSPFDDLAVYRQSEGAFYVRAASGDLLTKVSFGN